MRLRASFLVLTLAAAVVAPAARADDHYRGHGHGHGDHGHWSGSWVIGVPWMYGPGYWYGSPYYEPWPYERRIYIERERPRASEVPSGPPPMAYWYYCDSARAYYPYVSTCPEAWRQVPVEPANSGGSEPR